MDEDLVELVKNCKGSERVYFQMEPFCSLEEDIECPYLNEDRKLMMGGTEYKFTGCKYQGGNKK